MPPTYVTGILVAIALFLVIAVPLLVKYYPGPGKSSQSEQFQDSGQPKSAAWRPKGAQMQFFGAAPGGSDGGVVPPGYGSFGTYSPILVRPRNSLVMSEGPETHPVQTWADESVANNFYGMNRILSPDEYMSNLLALFTKVSGPVTGVSQSAGKTPGTPVSDRATRTRLADLVMARVNEVAAEMPEMNRNGSWGTERFFALDVKAFDMGSGKFRLVFILNNPLRSTSTLVTALVTPSGSGAEIQDLKPVSEAPETAGLTGLGADQVPGQVPDQEPASQIHWTFLGSVATQKFDKEGFGTDNAADAIVIEGGVPSSLEAQLDSLAGVPY